MSATSDKVVAACEKHWDTYKDDCSGFVRTVADELGVILIGLANDIVDKIQESPWTVLASGVVANEKAENGLVIGGLKETGHGHVVIVVPGDLNRGKYPTAYWGKLNGIGKKKTTVNWAWNSTDRDKVIYAWRQL